MTDSKRRAPRRVVSERDSRTTERVFKILDDAPRAAERRWLELVEGPVALHPRTRNGIRSAFERIRATHDLIHERLQRHATPEGTDEGSSLHGAWDRIILPDFAAIALLIGRGFRGQSLTILRRDIEVALTAGWIDMFQIFEWPLRYDPVDEMPRMSHHLWRNHRNSLMVLWKIPKTAGDNSEEMQTKRFVQELESTGNWGALLDAFSVGYCSEACATKEEGRAPDFEAHERFGAKWLRQCGACKKRDPAYRSLRLPSVDSIVELVAATWAETEKNVRSMQDQYVRLSRDLVHYNPYRQAPIERDDATDSRLSAAEVIREWTKSVEHLTRFTASVCEVVQSAIDSAPEHQEAN